MAKLCKHIFCNNKLFFLTEQKELICRASGTTEQILSPCTDFDVTTDKNGHIHIAAIDTKGNILYILNHSERWGKGKIVQAPNAENIFITPTEEGVTIFYVQNTQLFSSKITSDFTPPAVIAEISRKAMPFATSDDIYYLTTTDSLIRHSDKKSFCSGDINHIFVAGEWLCVRADGQVKIFSTAKNLPPEILTRRHSSKAQCPILTNTPDTQSLVWIDGDTVFSTFRNISWQRLKSTKTDPDSITAIFKFCTENAFEYCIATEKNGKFLHYPADMHHSGSDFSQRPSNSVAPSENPFVQIVNELSYIRKKLAEIDNKLDTISKNPLK